MTLNELAHDVHPADAQPSPSGRVVVIQGQSFSVREEACRVGDGSERTLVFSSDRIARRVRVFPSDWRSLSDEALAQLSWSR